MHIYIWIQFQNVCLTQLRHHAILRLATSLEFTWLSSHICQDVHHYFINCKSRRTLAFTNSRVFNLFAQRPTARLKGQTRKGNSLAFNGNVVLLRRTLQRKRQRVSAWGSVQGQLDCWGPCQAFKSGGMLRQNKRWRRQRIGGAGGSALWVKARR